MNSPLQYFIYARKSSEGEDRQVTSIEDQISEMTKLANDLNLTVVDIISESKSAKEPGRKGFDELLRRIEDGEAQGILCWKLNRLARNPIDGGRISWLLQRNVIQHIQTYGRDYKPTDNVIMMSVEFGMSNQYVKDLSVDVKRGYRKKAERGWYPITKLPLGYIHNPERVQNKGADEIIPDHKTFHIIKKLWGLLAMGIYSIADIKREGDALGLRNSSGTCYSLSSYHFIFSNEFYCGYYYWNGEDNSKVRYLGKHKPMVSEFEFNKVQEIYRKNSRATRNKTYSFPYRGLLACGECDGFVTAESKLQAICTTCKHKFSIKTKIACPKCHTRLDDMKKPSIIDKTYYHCTKKKHKECSQGSITQSSIESFIVTQLQNIHVSSDFIDFAIKGIEKLNKEEGRYEKQLVVKLKKRKTELVQRIQNLVQMRADGEISREQLENMKRSNREEITRIEDKIIKLEHITTKWVSITKEQLKFANTSLKKFKKGSNDVKKRIVSQLGSNLTLFDKSLYFKRENALWLIKDCANAYTYEKGRLEPKNSVVNKGGLGVFDALYPVLLEQLNAIRTYQKDNL